MTTSSLVLKNYIENKVININDIQEIWAQELLIIFKISITTNCECMQNSAQEIVKALRSASACVYESLTVYACVWVV